MPTQEQVDAYLPPYEPRQVLDPADPVSIGAMVGPEAFMEVRYLAHAKQMQALELIPAWAERVPQRVRPRQRRLVHDLPPRGRRGRRRGARLGARHHQGHRRRDARARRKIGVLGITCFRPWPDGRGARGAGGREARGRAREEPGGGARRHRLEQRGGFLRTAPRRVYTVVAGLGGRSITRGSLRRVREAVEGSLEPLTFLDLDHALVDRVLEREREQRRSGTDRRGHPARPRRGRGEDRLRARTPMSYQPIRFYQTGTFTVGNRLLPEQRSVQSTCAAPTRSTRATAPARAAARRSARATPSTPRWRPPTGSSSPPTPPAASRSSRRPTPRPPGRSPGSTRCSATRGGRHRHRGGVARQGPRATCAWSRRAATAAPPTSASAACRGCSSATTTCSTSATTTRPT
jgi:hypothetical protein